MARWMRRWCWSCAAVTWGLCLIGTAVNAGNAGGSGGGALDWKTVATAALGVVSILLGVYARSLERRVEAVEIDAKICGKGHAVLREEIARDHLTKVEIGERFDRAEADATRRFDKIESMVSAVHRRLDYIGGGQMAGGQS